LSTDGRFGLHLTAFDVERVRKLCAAAGARETGGVLFGRYTDDRVWAEVSEVTCAPADSRSGRTWFERGTHRLQGRVLRLWHEKRHYYLGEWHFHPGAAPDPSGTDQRQMRIIAESATYECPEPVLLILGGNPDTVWRFRCFVYPRTGGRVEMLPVSDGIPPAKDRALPSGDPADIPPPA
jgi:integrative and conjugative element protein (TIGR02256 family)